MVDLDKPKIEEKETFDGVIRDLRKEDLASLIPILGTWIKDRNTGQPLPDEVRETIQTMLDSVEGRNPRTYIVAEQDGEVIGVMGFKDPDIKMDIWAVTSTPAELINAYVKADERKGKGVGKALVAELERKAKAQGYTEIILNSGPRYKETGWGFYDKLPGYKRIGISAKHYGEGGDAPVWQKILE